MKRIFTQLIFLACIMLVLAVGLGAFGAHLLKDQLGEHGTGIWNTANRYHFYHSLGMILILILGRQYHFPRILWLTAFTFFWGIVFFSGSLYLLALYPEWRWLGPITPVGGLLFLGGWLMAAVAMFSLQAKE
jgi:uncharacterized membrane protein YgdD (TMEM256/DUF423 family)